MCVKDTELETPFLSFVKNSTVRLDHYLECSTFLLSFFADMTAFQPFTDYTAARQISYGVGLRKWDSLVCLLFHLLFSILPFCFSHMTS